MNVPPWFDYELRRLTNEAHHWNKFRKVRNELQKLLQVKHNQFIADMPDTLKKTLKRFWSYFRSKTKKIEIASNNNTGESLPVPLIVKYKHVYRIMSIIYRIRCLKGALQPGLQ